MEFSRKERKGRNFLKVFLDKLDCEIVMMILGSTFGVEMITSDSRGTTDVSEFRNDLSDYSWYWINHCRVNFADMSYHKTPLVCNLIHKARAYEEHQWFS